MAGYYKEFKVIKCVSEESLSSKLAFYCNQGLVIVSIIAAETNMDYTRYTIVFEKQTKV